VSGRTEGSRRAQQTQGGLPSLALLFSPLHLVKCQLSEAQAGDGMTQSWQMTLCQPSTVPSCHVASLNPMSVAVNGWEQLWTVWPGLLWSFNLHAWRH
jgi:hypothetical protein